METSFQNFLERLTRAYIKEIESFLELVKSIEVNLINFPGNQQAWRAQFLFFKGFLLMLEEISLFGGGGGGRSERWTIILLSFEVFLIFYIFPRSFRLVTR